MSYNFREKTLFGAVMDDIQDIQDGDDDDDDGDITDLTKSSISCLSSSWGYNPSMSRGGNALYPVLAPKIAPMTEPRWTFSPPTFAFARRPSHT